MLCPRFLVLFLDDAADAVPGDLPHGSSCLALVEEGVAVCLKEFRKGGGRLATYPLHKVACACEDSVLVVLGYLLKMLPQGVSIKISPPTVTSLDCHNNLNDSHFR